MTNTIHNVPRELLEELRDAANESMNATTRQHQIDHFAGLIAKADALLSAPSPAGVDGCKGKNCGVTDGVSHSDECFAEHERAYSCAGVDGLEVVGTLRYFMDYPDSPHSAPGYITHQFNPASWDHAGEAAGEHKLCRLSDAQAIIDGLRGDADYWKRMFNQSEKALDRVNALRSRDGAKQAQRIGELEGLLRESGKTIHKLQAEQPTPARIARYLDAIRAMTNTIPNVPRQLLADLLGNDHDKRIMAERHLLAMLANAPSPANHVEDVRAMVAAPSPAGVDGCKCSMSISMLGDGCRHCQPQEYIDRLGEMLDEERAELSDAQAIIDWLRGEVAAQEETANQWRELALQFDRHRMTAMAHIRAAASGDKSAIEALGVFAALPPIPGHEITAERDQLARRIGELEGLLRDSAELIKHGVFEDGYCCCGSSVDSHGLGDGHSPVDALAYHAGQVCERIDAALSAVCAAAPNIATTSEHSGS